MKHRKQVCAIALCCLGWAWSSAVAAEAPSSTWIGRQTAGVVIGGMLPVRLMEGQSSKLNGVAVHPSWKIALTDPIGDRWRSGSLALGAEAALLRVAEPTGAYGIGFTPKLAYMLASFGRLKPYVAGGGGPLWTNFDGRIPEQGTDFNFLVWIGTGATDDLSPRWALNTGVRLSHISNSGIESPNGGLKYLLPFAGVSAKLF